MFVYFRGKDQIDLMGQTLMSEDEAEGLLAAFGTVSLINGGRFVLSFIAKRSLSVSCGVGAPLCAVLIEATVWGAGALSTYLVNDPPAFGSAVYLREYSAESLRQLNCNKSFAGS